MRRARPLLAALALLPLCLQGEEPPKKPGHSPEFLTLEGIKAFEAGDLDTGRAKLTAVLEIDGDNLIALVNLGSLEYRAGRKEEAEKHLRRATRVDPESFHAWLTRGVVAYESGNDDLALAALAHAVLLEPNHPQARTFLGITLGRKGWHTGAAMELQRAVSIDDSLPDAHFNLAVVYLQQTPPAPELARFHYEKARKLGAEPDSVVEKQLSRSKEKPSAKPKPASTP